MSLSTLPLSYCTNVHAGQTVDAVISGLKEHTVAAQKLFGQRLAAGLWLAAPVIHELVTTPGAVSKLQAVLAEHELTCHTLNAFPYGDFHSARVKENVYLPDWTSDSRRTYTLQCAQVLAQLMPVGVEGSISTVPLGFKGFTHPADFQEQCIAQLLELANDLDQLHDETGQVIRLAIEPEPCCVLETTAETIAFFAKLYAAADQKQLLDAAKRHLGVCYDICHQAVEFEDIPVSIQQLADAEIRINKVHITCAVELATPAENAAGREQLAEFVEQRYLHQTFARSSTGKTFSVLDLTRELCGQPPADFQQAESWRIHFHVPVHKEVTGVLHTTRGELKPALKEISRLLYAPHLEVETYTWGVLPGEQPQSLAEGIASELTATQQLLAEIR